MEKNTEEKRDEFRVKKKKKVEIELKKIKY